MLFAENRREWLDGRETCSVSECCPETRDRRYLIGAKVASSHDVQRPSNSLYFTYYIVVGTRSHVNYDATVVALVA